MTEDTAAFREAAATPSWFLMPSCLNFMSHLMGSLHNFTMANDLLKPFELFIVELTQMAAKFRMSNWRDTYDGANEYGVGWCSHNQLDCGISLTYLPDPYPVLHMKAIARFPKSSGIDAFYYLRDMGLLFPDTEVSDFRDRLEKSRFWADQKEILHEEGNEVSITPIIDALYDINPEQRWVATKALGLFHSPRATEVLIAALNDLDYKVKRFAIIGLGNNGDSKAIPALTKIWEDGDQADRTRVEEALNKINRRCRLGS